MTELSDNDLKTAIRTLIPSVDLNTTGVKKFIQLLETELGGVELKHRKEFIKQALSEAINDEDSDEANVDEEEDDDNDNTPTPERKEKGGLAAKKEISEKLAKFLGKGDRMSRTEIVKLLWEYIRGNNLQNPDNKREILLDDAMKEVFGCDKFTMFTMNKYIGAHIDPFKPVDLTTNSTPPRALKRRASPKASSEKKKRKAGTQPPYRLSDELVAVVGESILPRPQVVSKIWDYIKTNELQNPNDKREILCDEKLQAVMKKPKVTMFNMNQAISAHLIEKVDKSEYTYEGVADDDSYSG